MHLMKMTLQMRIQTNILPSLRYSEKRRKIRCQLNCVNALQNVILIKYLEASSSLGKRARDEK